MRKQVIIVAGGSGLRMGTDIPKQFLLLDGKPVLMHTIEAFYNYDPDIFIILVLPEKHQSYWKTLCETYHFRIAHQIVFGGNTRFHSVKNGLKLVTDYSLVAVHDGARALVTEDVIKRTFDAAASSKMACPVIPVTDSLRRTMRIGSRSVSRESYCLVQTPQIFVSKILLKAYEQDYLDEFTDDVSVVSALRSSQTVLVEGSPENIKITTPLDLAIAETIIKLRIKSFKVKD